MFLTCLIKKSLAQLNRNFNQKSQSHSYLATDEIVRFHAEIAKCDSTGQVDPGEQPAHGHGQQATHAEEDQCTAGTARSPDDQDDAQHQQEGQESKRNRPS